jgi:hypothetical protein
LATLAGARGVTDYPAEKYGLDAQETAELRRSELSLVDGLEGPPSPWYSPADKDDQGTAARGRGAYDRRFSISRPELADGADE